MTTITLSAPRLKRIVPLIMALALLMEMTLSDELPAACDALVASGSAVANFFNSVPWMGNPLRK